MKAFLMETPTVATLGDKGLDEDHDRFLRAVQVLGSAPLHGAVAALDVLRGEASQHFATEDADLWRMGDGNAKCHIDEHGAVLRSLDEVRDFLTAGEQDEASKAVLVQRLAAQLGEWLPMHVQEMDTNLATFRVSSRFGGAPVRISRK